MLNVIDNDYAADFYKKSNEILKDHNFLKYEVSSYAKKGFDCKHNKNYWKSENWIGIGPGAYGRLWCSKQNIKRVEYQNYKNPKTWLFKNINCKFNHSLNSLRNYPLPKIIVEFLDNLVL